MRPSIGLALALCAGVVALHCAEEGSLTGMSAQEDNGRAAGRTDAGSGAGSDAGGPECLVSSDCPTSFSCEAGVCRPPEVEHDRGSETRPPTASPHYVWALNPSADAVARIDPATLSIEAIQVGAQPVDLVALPNEDAAAVLCFGDGALWLLDATSPPTRTIRVPLARPLSRMAVSADGRWAIAFPDPALPPASGAEGVVTVVDLAAARSGGDLASTRFERAAGFRVTDVVFRLEAGAAREAYVFAKATVAVIDLADPAAHPLPRRISLPASMSADVASREVVADATGTRVMLRSTTAPEIAAFDGDAITVVPLPEIATDLDLVPDGTAAVAALRAADQLAYLLLPDDLANPSGIRYLPVAGVFVGQVVLPPVAPAGGSYALVFTTSSDEERFARVDLPGGAVTLYDVQKWVESIRISPDGRSALVIHEANAASTAADDYEKAVDRDQGYSVFDLSTGYVQLNRTGTARPGPFAFSPAGGYVALALSDAAVGRFTLDTVDLSTLVSSAMPLASEALFMGPIPAAPDLSPHRIFVSQDHTAGRLSVVTLDTREIRTATGFTLNAEIE